MRLAMATLMMAAAACTSTNFGSDPGKRQNGTVQPLGGQQNPAKEPLDVSQIDLANQALAEGGAAVPGTGAPVERTIQVTCDQQAGASVAVGSSGSGATAAGGGGQQFPQDGQDDQGSDGEGDAGLRLQAQDPQLGKDGQPITPPGKTPGGQPELPEQPPQKVPQAAKVKLTVKGEFCPTTKNQLTVLFVVDYSGSMGRHVPRPGLAEVPGNDPLVSGSCGRLRAAQAILAKIKAQRAPTDAVTIGLVPFAGGIVTDRLVSLRSLDDFEATVSAGMLCSFVTQRAAQAGQPGYPGGVASPGIDSSTNYTAAFTAAGTLLSRVYGKKEVYFISDGEPTSGGADPVQAGIQAGERLRQSVDNLTLNGLLLGSQPQAEAVLTQVAGAAERVRRAENADDLADQILDFPDPSIDEGTGRASLTVAPYPKADLGLRALVQDPQKPGVWLWETQPFYLLGKPGEVVLNVVEVTAQGKDGSRHQAVVKVRYRQ